MTASGYPGPSREFSLSTGSSNTNLAYSCTAQTGAWVIIDLLVLNHFPIWRACEVGIGISFAGSSDYLFDIEFLALATSEGIDAVLQLGSKVPVALFF